MSYKTTDPTLNDYTTMSYTATTESFLDVYDRKFNSLMKLSKEALVEMILGERPVNGPVRIFTNYNSPFENF